MPSRTGTASLVDASGGNGSTSVDVPANCNAVVAFWGHWNFDGGSTLSGLTLDGDSFLPAEAEKAEGVTPAETGVGVAVLVNPSTGTQTLAWTWSDNDVRAEGGEIILVYIQDANTADPVRDAAVDSATTDNDVSVTIDTESDDLVLGFAGSFNFEGIIPDISLTEFIDNAVLNSHVFDVGEDAAPSSPSTTVDMTGEAYSWIAAISLKAAAGGGEVELAGTLESMSEALGSLDVHPALVASSESVSDAEAALDAGLGLSATVESVSEVNGSAGLSIGFSGAAESESDLSAAIGLLVGLSGAMSSVSESAGSLGMDVGLSGAAVSVSDLLGSLEVVGEFLLSGIAESVSDAEGSLSSDLGLSGVSDSVSELMAALSVSAELLLSGTSESVSEVSGALGLDMRLAGALSSESDLDAMLSLLQSLRGRSESVTQAIGALALELALSGDIESVSELLGVLDRATEGGYLAVDRIRFLSALEGRIDLVAALDAEVLVQPKD